MDAATTQTNSTSSSSIPNPVNAPPIPQSHTNPNPPAQTQMNQFVGAPAPPYVQPMLPSLNQPLTIKLNRDNYLIWKNRLLNIIIANGLDEFLDGTHPYPSWFLDAHQLQTNHHYTLWQSYNRLIMS